jgi:hypothetical protein
MFWTEALIAPIVVLAIFFLFTLTGIAGDLAGRDLDHRQRGVRLHPRVCGFDGLLDTIKKRIFPEPEAAS